MRLRSPVIEDAPAVLDVLVARDLADLGAADYTLEDLLDEWRASEFDLGSDAIVGVTDTGEVVAYAVVQRSGARVVVAPDCEGHGFGTGLLRWVEQRDRALGRSGHRQWLGSGNARGQALLRGAGYELVRSYWRMARALGDGAVHAAPPPPGMSLRALDVSGDAVAIHALDQASFAGNPDYEPETPAEFRHEHLEAHDLDPGLSLVAEHADWLVGLLLARRWAVDAVGYVDLLGVHPEVQGRGLGTALLTHAFAGFAAAGLREAQLGVASDNPRALSLYERAGMAAKFRADVFERPLSAPTPAGVQP